MDTPNHFTKPPPLPEFLDGLIKSAARRPDTVKLTAWGQEREFERYDTYDDTFILEAGILGRLQNKEPVVLLPKSALCAAPGKDERRVFGNIMTVSTGNHAVTSMPLVSGKFWDLPAPPEELRAAAISSHAVYANIVGGTLEISQREAPTAAVVEMDDWLQDLGCPMSRIVLIDRKDETLQHYSRRGQEWRIKPLAWTRDGMRDALRASQGRMHSLIRYHHNVKGAHFLTLANFLEFGALARADPPEFLRGLAELAAPGAENAPPNMLLKKYRNHHEVEFFGPPPGAAQALIVPRVIDLYEHVRAGCAPDDAAERFAAVAETFRAALQSPALADESSAEFIEALYRNITGAVYFDERPDAAKRAFDDMRTALPGATYGMPEAAYGPTGRKVHEGADQRAIVMLDTVEQNVSHGDRMEYANIYELRSAGAEAARPGEGATREIVYKTMWQPLPMRMIEKRLAHKSTGYGTYTMARVQAFRALGVSFGMHKLLSRNDGRSGDIHFFFRSRYPGEPFSTLPESCFHDRNPIAGKYDNTAEAQDIVRALITLMGSAAAENMILKKRIRDSDSIRFAEGKEIVEFGYDVMRGKEMPIRIWLCSVRGTMGWPDISHTEGNIAAMFEFYTRRYAQAAFEYALKHPALDRFATADAFFTGFTSRTNEIAWNYANRREEFDAYAPRIWRDFKFDAKWRFALWALEAQRGRIKEIGDIFHTEFTALCEKAHGGAAHE